MDQLKPIRFQWEGPLQYKEVLCKDDKADYGIYQIYSHHAVFGPKSLCHIGKSVQQTFAKRFVQHWENWLNNESEIAIYLGRLWKEDRHEDDEWQEWAQLIDNAEKLLIATHTPPYNSQYITRYFGNPLHIQNWGDKGSILPELSSHWRFKRPDDTVNE